MMRVLQEGSWSSTTTTDVLPSGDAVRRAVASRLGQVSRRVPDPCPGDASCSWRASMLRWCCGGAGGAADDHQQVGDQQVSLLIPSYIWPDAAVYAQLAQAGPSAIAIVTGGSSGPPEAGSPHTQLYRQTFGRLAKSGVRVVGYVHVSYGARPLQQALAAVRDWYAGYGDLLSGVFVDEAACEALDESIAYTAALRQAVKAQGAEQLLILNPGVAVENGLGAQADVVLTYEDSWANWVKQTASSQRGRIAAAAGKPAAAATAAAVHNTGRLSADDIRAQVARAARLGYRYLYLTDAALPNPWAQLPCHWDELVAATRQTSRT